MPFLDLSPDDYPYTSDNNIIVSRRWLGTNDYGVGAMLPAGYGFFGEGEG